jgi:hypothetical protein
VSEVKAAYAAYVAKAITAALVAGLTGIATGLDDGKLSWQEVVTALVALLVALGAVYRVPNGPKP